MKRMLLIGCLIIVLAFTCFGCSSGTNSAHASNDTEEVDTSFKPISIRMFDVYAATEDGQVFYRPYNTKAWVTDEDEQAFLTGDRLRYGGKYSMKGMIDSPIIICKPINYYHSVQVADQEDYGVTSDQIIMPPVDVPYETRHDIRVYSSAGKLLWFFSGYITWNDLDLFKSGGNLRFRGSGDQWSPEGIHLIKAPIITITEDIIIRPIPMDPDEPHTWVEGEGDTLD